MSDTVKEQAQDAIIAACVNAAFKADDAGERDLAIAIRKEATRLAKRYGLSEVSGLPGTYPTKIDPIHRVTSWKHY